MNEKGWKFKVAYHIISACIIYLIYMLAKYNVILKL